MKFANRFAVVAAIVLAVAGCSQREHKVDPADLVFVNGVIYTADDAQRAATALAVTGERIVFVGDDAGAQALVGEGTEVVDLQGRMLLPGLHDMHIHPMGIVDDGGCDLESEPVDLEEMAAIVRGCIAEQQLPPGEWLTVDLWSYAAGNQPAGGFTTLRQALDAGAPDNPVILWGNDGHHGAVNSAALARAVNSRGVIVGIDRDTLQTEFAEYREVIGVNAAGEPNGEVHETARDLLQPPPPRLFAGLEPEGMRQMAAILASNGITTIMDAAAPPESLAAYRSLLEAGGMTFNLSIALFLEPPDYRTAQGFDIGAMLDEAKALREEFASVPQIRVDTAKIFVDGVLEGNPLNDPPTLPNAAVMNPYQQPRLEFDPEANTAEILGYVDTDSELCQKVRDAMEYYLQSGVMASFHREFGFYPQQCRLSRGVLEQPAEFVSAYMQALDGAGFKIHAHVIGDRALHTALDGFESLPGDSGRRHSLAHIHLVAPEDYQRIGRLGLYLVFTYAWLTPEFFYDMTVNPFIDRLDGVGDLYRPDSYYMTNAYPAAQLQALGAVLAAGSDAPVDTRDPRPFVNIEQAVTRANDAGQVLNPAGRIGIRDALDAYTINGARLFGHEAQTGSLESGKYADLVMIDQDLLGLVEQGRADEIADSRVLLTVFRGREVYRAP